MQEAIRKTSSSKKIKIEENRDFIPLSLSLSPAGALYLYTDSEILETLPTTIAEKIDAFFSLGSAVGLLRLGLTDFNVPLSSSFSF